MHDEREPRLSCAQLPPCGTPGCNEGGSLHAAASLPKPLRQQATAHHHASTQPSPAPPPPTG
eukprot:132288-Chlamydomonas_euryale.AAC.2